MRRRISSSLLYLFVCLMALFPACRCLGGESGTNAKPLWLVVTKPTFLQALEPLKQKRIQDGFKTLVSTERIDRAIAALDSSPEFLLLIGDAERGKEKEPWHVPSRTCKLYRWRSVQRPEFESDALWGDFDADLIPDVPVGRIPVRTAEQLTVVVKKILAFEAGEPGPEDLCMPIWAGSSGYNPMMDSMATFLLLSTVEKKAASWIRPWVISGDPMHSLCGWPPEQGAMFSARYKSGGLFAVLMGHASARSFHSMNYDGASIDYADTNAKADFAAGKPGPPMVIIACHAGRFAGRQSCLAESLLTTPGGPVAVIAATTESHPLTNYFSGLALLEQTNLSNKRLGSLWLAAQNQAFRARDMIMERMLVDVEGKLEEKMNVEKLRRDQILMYALLGDPATPLRLPDPLEAAVERDGGAWRWTAKKPKDATRLYVGLRPESPPPAPRAAHLDKDAAEKLFRQANETFAFKPLAELDSKSPWRGVIEKQGTLRLVAVGPHRIYAAALKLKPDATTGPGR